MAEERTVINWKSDNLDTYLASKLYDIKLDLIKNSYEALGISMPESKTIKSHKFIYDNDSVKENGMFSSHVSSGAAIVAMNRYSYGDFIIPKEILTYIKDEYSLGNANEKNLPSKDVWQKNEAGQRCCPACRLPACDRFLLIIWYRR